MISDLHSFFSNHKTIWTKFDLLNMFNEIKKFNLIKTVYLKRSSTLLCN